MLRSVDEAPQLESDDDQIVPTPPVYVLDDLLDQITTDNGPNEWDMGTSVGNEVW